MSREHTQYTLISVAIPLAAAAAILALAEGNLGNTIGCVVSLAVWSIGFTAGVGGISKHRKMGETRHTTDKSPRNRRTMIIIRTTVWLCMLTIGTALLARVLFINAPLYLVLEVILLIIISGGELLYVRFVLDK